MKAGKKIHLKHLSPDCQTLLKNAEKVIEVNVLQVTTVSMHAAQDFAQNFSFQFSNILKQNTFIKIFGVFNYSAHIQG